MSSHHNKKDFANQERQKMKLNKPDNLFQDLHYQLKMLTELLKNNKNQNQWLLIQLHMEKQN